MEIELIDTYDYSEFKKLKEYIKDANSVPKSMFSSFIYNLAHVSVMFGVIKEYKVIVRFTIDDYEVIHREYSNPYPAKLIIEEDVMRTENANKARMIGNIDINSYEPYPKNPKIYSGCIPEFKENDIFKTIIPLKESKMSDQDVTKMSDQDVTKISDQDRIIDFCIDAKSLIQIMEMMGYKHKSNFRKNFIIPLLENNKLEMTMPEKPNSKYQKYIKSKK